MEVGKGQTDAFEFTKRETLNNDKITTEFKTLMFGSPFETTQAKVQTTTIKANDINWLRQAASSSASSRPVPVRIRLVPGYQVKSVVAMQLKGDSTFPRFSRREFVVVFSSQV